MAAKEKVFQLLITLNDISPQIWRRIVVSEKSTLYDLHLILQIAFKWSNSHLHEFLINDKRYSDPNLFKDAYEKPISDKRTSLKKLGLQEKDEFRYTYDFGDDWIHTIKLEKILLPEENQVYPVCLEGKNASPPEDCGGPFAYEMLLQAIKAGNPEEFDLFMDDEQFYDLLEDFDPEMFDMDKVNSHLATDGKVLAGNDDIRKKANQSHQEKLVEEFVEEIYEKFSFEDASDEFKRFCLHLPLRKDIIVIMEYLLKNKVVGTRSTGNFPLKDVKGICAKFDTPISLHPLGGDFFTPIRSEDEVFRLQLLHYFANTAGLIVGDAGTTWEVTVLGKAFLEVTPVEQVRQLFYEWFNNFIWTFLFPIDFEDSDAYTKFVVTTLVHLLNLEVGEFVPFSRFVDQVYEVNEPVFLNHIEEMAGHMFEQKGWFSDQEEIRKAKAEMAWELAATVTEQMIVYPMRDFGVLEAIPAPKEGEKEGNHQFSTIALTGSGNVLLEGLWDRFNNNE